MGRNRKQITLPTKKAKAKRIKARAKFADKFERVSANLGFKSTKKFGSGCVSWNLHFLA